MKRFRLERCWEGVWYLWCEYGAEEVRALSEGIAEFVEAGYELGRNLRVVECEG